MSATIADLPECAASLVDKSLLNESMESKKITVWICGKCAGSWRESIAKRCRFNDCPKCSLSHCRTATVFPKGVPLHRSTKSTLPENNMDKITPIAKKSKEVMCEVCCLESRSIVKCPMCQYECCVECLERYILDGIGAASCMASECSKPFTLVFLASVYGKKWVMGKYREFLNNALIEHEKSLIPSTMDLVALLKERSSTKRRTATLLTKHHRLYRSDDGDRDTRISELETLVQYLNDRVDELDEMIDAYPEIPDGHVADKRVMYIQGCPGNGCKGLIASDTMACSVCSTKVCEECRLVHKGKCNPNDVQTVKMMKGNTKPCPSCAVPVFKIDGCDQMWCTGCNTAFSWTTLRVVTGAIHNPHYFEWLRRNSENDEIPRDAGRVGHGRAGQNGECGAWEPRELLDRRLSMNVPSDKARVFNQMRDMLTGELEMLQYCINQTNHELCIIRAKYIMGKYPEDTWKRRAIAYYDDIACLRVRIQVIETVAQIMGDRIAAVREALTTHSKPHSDVGKVVEGVLAEAEKVRLYFNKVIVDERCGSKLIVISREWLWVTLAEAKRDEHIHSQLQGK